MQYLAAVGMASSKTASVQERSDCPAMEPTNMAAIKLKIGHHFEWQGAPRTGHAKEPEVLSSLSRMKPAPFRKRVIDFAIIAIVGVYATRSDGFAHVDLLFHTF
jgi:hypothetical protein